MSAFFHDMNEAKGAEIVGGKAAMLMRLVAQGFDVPEFFAIEPAAFDGGMAQTDIEAAIAERLVDIGPGPYATRSSAREEDGVSASHAGQFLSVLNLAAYDVPAAARKVFESGLKTSVADYRVARGLGDTGAAPAVIVQQMVAARCAGVAFSADPVNGRRDRVIVSAITGLGDRLVGGEEDGQGFVLRKADGAVLEAPADPVLASADLAALHALAVAIERVCGGPQDIEWAFEGERLYLLQARPITTVLRGTPIDDSALTVFDNSNIVESYPGLVSPLTFSFAQYAYSRVYRAFVGMVGIKPAIVAQNAAVFDNLLARVDGRVYYNLGNWYRALALLPGFANNTARMELMMGVDQPLPAELVAAMSAPRGPALRRWLGVASISLHLGLASLRLGSTIRGFYRRVETVLASPAASLDTMSLTALAAEYRRIEADLLDRWDAPLVNDFLCMIAFGASRQLMQKWAGAAGLALHSDIMVGQGDMISAEPAKRIRAMGRMLDGHADLVQQLSSGSGDGIDAHPELAAAISAYLERFADRCAEELKLESVTLDRDPSPLYRAIASTATVPPASRLGRTDSATTLRRVFGGKPVRRLVASIALGVAKRRVRDRENLRFERTRIFGRGRRLFRAAGAQFHGLGLLDAPDDIFFLTVSEVLGAIEGFATSHDLAAIARLRRAELVAAAARTDPGERLMLRGAVSAGVADLAPPIAHIRDETRERSGIGCSAGVVTAVARVIRDPRTQVLARGEVLVARHTDPGWIALFTNAAAIVVERGSPLSHSAIVARELGIPCVVALKGAMDWIIDGETIEIDGMTGSVRRLG
jgi:pyruvate,water dikinase